MEQTTKKDYLEVYVNASLNEIKEEVKREINLQEERMHETDKVMKTILEDLINEEDKNIQKGSKENLLYTLLPLSDDQEHKKIRNTLVLMYTAIYFNNVSLLKKLQSSGVNLIYYSRLSHTFDKLALSLLDNTITSHFDEDEYLEIVKKHKSVFDTFYKTVIKADDKEKDLYLERFVRILKEITIPLNKVDAHNLFGKQAMSIFEDETYLKASKEQLNFLSANFNSYETRNITPEAKRRLNNLIQTTDFSSYCKDYDIIFKLFTDKDILNMDWPYAVSWYFNKFSESDELLNKAIDLYRKYPKIAELFSKGLVNPELIKTVNNDMLILMLKPKMLVRKLVENYYNKKYY